jgi:histidyl-tRNA synthetase
VRGKVEFSPTLARGLDYYTGIIFEIEIDGYTAGSVCGGGRYDNLIGMFGNKQVPAVGFAFGFDRVLEALEELSLFPTDLTTTQVLVTVFSMEMAEKSIDITNDLRNKGINAEVYLDANAKMEKQLKYADVKQIPFAIIVGPDEAKNNQVTIRNLKTREQKQVSFDNLSAEFS